MQARSASTLLVAVSCLVIGAAIGFYVPPVLTTTRTPVPVHEAPLATRPTTHENRGMAYLPHLELFDIVSYRTNAPMGRVAAVRLKVRNAGDRTVVRLEVTLKFRDTNDEVVRTGRVVPIRDQQLPFFQGSVLLPGHLFEMESGRYFAFENVPDSWQVGNVTAEITLIETD